MALLDTCDYHFLRDKFTPILYVEIEKMKRGHSPILEVIDLTSPAQVIDLTAPAQLIDLTDSPPASKVAKTAAARHLMGLKVTDRLGPKVTPDTRRGFSPPPRRFFNSQRQASPAEGQSRRYSHQQNLDVSSDDGVQYRRFSESGRHPPRKEREEGGEWASFPGPEVFSHPSARFRTALNPDPDFFRPVAEELARGLPEPRSGESGLARNQLVRKTLYLHI